MTATGPGRRLTEAEEAKAAGLFAAKASDRQVAEALGIGAGTANRLRHRLSDRIAALAGQVETPASEPDEDGGQADEDAELAALQEMRDAQAQTVAGLQEREAVSREAMATLDAEHLAGLAEGRADPELRQRRQNAADDATDWAKAAELAQAKLAAIDQQAAAIVARQDLAAMRAELAAAVADRDEVCARSGERQRAAVLAVSAAAEEFTATFTEEQAAGLCVDQLAQAVAGRAQAAGEPLPVVPPAPFTMLAVPGDAMAGGPLALARAMHQARDGNVANVAVHLAEALGWLPPSPEELAADQAMWQERAAAAAGSVPAEVTGVQHPAHWPASVNLDADGSPMLPPDPERPRPQQAVRPGALGFQPFPR